LSEVEQALLAQLSVFSGGWTLEAAEEVCSISSGRVLDTLSALVDKSLVQSAESTGMARFSMLETIRQYGSEKLLESGESDRVRRHLDYFLDFAERCDRESRGPRSLEWKRRMDAEHNNLRAALEYTFSTEGASDTVVRLIRAVGGFNGVWWCGFWKEAIYWLEKALAHPNARPGTALRARLLSDCAVFDGSAPFEKLVHYSEESLAIFDVLGEAYGVERARVLMWLGFRLCFLLDARQKGTRYMEEALRVFEDAGDTWNQAFALNLYASVIFEVDRDFNVAWTLAERGMEVARQTGEQFLIAVLTDDFGIFAVEHGLFDQGQDYLEEALEVYRRFEGFAFACQTLKWLGDAARGLNNFAKAEVYYRESLAMTQDVGMLNFGINVRLSLGLTVLHQGDVRQALSLFTEALDVAHETRKPDFPKFTAFYFLDCVGAALAVQGRADAAARFFGAFDAQLEAFLAEGFTSGRLFDAIDLQEHEHFLALCRAQLDEATFDCCWQEGRALTLEEAVEFAGG
jgi:tetratricopeptide (TPR) repeat protein